ncbi:MAG: hypothetical protein HZA34_02205 [Candidatus Pacebacteria bacterium]|nr:hypothetical protein [Candidatus Paceibacterota bacterium]
MTDKLLVVVGGIHNTEVRKLGNSVSGNVLVDGNYRDIIPKIREKRPHTVVVCGALIAVCIGRIAEAALEYGSNVIIDLKHCRIDEHDSGDTSNLDKRHAELNTYWPHVVDDQNVQIIS